MKIDRRRALALLGLGAASPALAQAPATYAGPVSFLHGVASGDPLQDRLILWTRITPAQAGTGDIAYRWRLDPVGKGRKLAKLAKSGEGVTGPGRDYTVKVDVAGLKPGRDYVFWFEANGVTSPVGKTRTLPEGKTPDVVLAVASCALYPNGYFNAYGAIAALPRVDAILHVGDYIYEYGGPGSYGMDSKVAYFRPHDPPHECESLDDYRRRHAQYKTDPMLQAAHARAPWIVVWDDHETANDSYKDGAQNHTPIDEGPWNERKARAIKAYFEWMPIREPADGGFAINRTFHFGDLASLFMLETRLTARDKQLVYERDLAGMDGKPDVKGFKTRLYDPDRRMMGEAQEQWLGQELANSVKSGRTWQVLGNEVVMARVNVASLKKELDPAVYAKAMAGVSAAGKQRIERLELIASLGLPYGLDMWDGYPVDRERVYAAIKAAGARTIVVSGDSHAFWANELYDAAGTRVAAEFGATGITSPGGGDALPTVPLGEVYAKANKEVVYNNQAAKGFVLLTLTPTEAKGELIKVSSIVTPGYTVSVDKAFRVTPEPGGISAVTEI
ncbi:alkaline phosphatase D family protein [Phenylobacterium aquaticum]|uniref:alkaline phosphatase D family protein n=1 Tax=Phenylobacterium aquaticum TaxID=1763816 RepID=UPI001F5C7428|nr:alkaline phosphatase D family protein [Phenylobacterium aquaticum]MCI3132953.1 alkaline phosphatase D family protein [Phenylobacterium aquaticum]